MRVLFYVAIMMISAPAAAAGAGENAPAKEKVICIKEPIVGTRIATKRICKTAAQWKADEREAKQLLEKATNTQTNPSG